MSVGKIAISTDIFFYDYNILPGFGGLGVTPFVFSFMNNNNMV
jgi:hypothetical protein